MKRFSCLVACLISLSAAAEEPLSHRRADIQSVIEAFRTAIIDKDKARFVKLFVPGHVTWQSVKGDESLRRAREDNPKAPKVRINPENNPLSFIDEIVAEKTATEEKFDNIRIDTDGDVASVTFDYRFLDDGHETNHGKEAWQLVRAEEAWWIVSVIWSVNLPPKPEPKR